MLLTLPSLAPIRVFLPGVAHANRMRWTLFQKQRMIKEWRCVSLCWRIVNGLFAWWHLKFVSMCPGFRLMSWGASYKKHFVSKACECTRYYIPCFVSAWNVFPHMQIYINLVSSHPYFKTCFLPWLNFTWAIWAKLFTLLAVGLILLFVVPTLIEGYTLVFLNRLWVVSK